MFFRWLQNRSDETKKSLILLLCAVVFFASTSLIQATTPNPGHPWSETGDGTFAVTGPTVARTYTFPDANSTILTSNSTVTVGQGGTGATTLTGILKGNGTSPFTAVTAPSGAIVGDTDTQTLTNKTIALGSNTLTGVAASGANSDITSLSALSTPLSVAQGGTGAATLTANNLLIGNGTGAMSFLAPGTSGNYVKSNGTTWTSAAPTTISSVVVKTFASLSAFSNSAISSQTTRNVAMFNIPAYFTLGQITFNVVTATSAGTVKLCIYSEDGATLMADVTTASISTIGVKSIAVSPTVDFAPGNYWLAVGCASSCNLTLNFFNSSNTVTGNINGASLPPGESALEGTVTHSSGVCDSSLGAVTASTAKGLAARLDT